jgi:hypothetical protein
VMRVIESPSPWLFKPEAGRTWLDAMKEKFEQSGVVNLFPGGGPTLQIGGRLRMPARLAYYRGDRIVEEDVEDLGRLLEAILPPEPVTERIEWQYSTPAIDLDCSCRQQRGPAVPPRDPLTGSLGFHTDIWLPRVLGLELGDAGGRLDPVHPARGRDRMMDNSALAARHTPRLNRFIQTLREAVQDLGGTWEFGRGDGVPQYLPMLYEGGINLDYPAASA